MLYSSSMHECMTLASFWAEKKSPLLFLLFKLQIQSSCKKSSWECQGQGFKSRSSRDLFSELETIVQIQSSSPTNPDSASSPQLLEASIAARLDPTDTITITNPSIRSSPRYQIISISISLARSICFACWDRNRKFLIAFAFLRSKLSGSGIEISHSFKRLMRIARFFRSD